LKKRPGRIHLERLLGYSPQPSRVGLESIEAWFKESGFTSLEDLTVAVLDQVKSLEREPNLVQAFFNNQEVAFITH